jgi:hypothetical protein
VKFLAAWLFSLADSPAQWPGLSGLNRSAQTEPWFGSGGLKVLTADRPDLRGGLSAVSFSNWVACGRVAVVFKLQRRTVRAFNGGLSGPLKTVDSDTP